MTEKSDRKQAVFSARKARIAVLALVCMVLTTAGYVLGETRHSEWHDMFKYDGTVRDVYGVKRPALVPLRNVWLLVDQESGSGELAKGTFMNCHARACDRKVRSEGEQEDAEYSVTELLLDCKEDGGRVFVVKGLAGTN